MNLIASRKREHSRKPDELYDLIEACSWGPYLELFARNRREHWTVWGNEAPDELERFTGRTYGKAYSIPESGAEVVDNKVSQLRLLERSPDYRTRRKNAG